MIESDLKGMSKGVSSCPTHWKGSAHLCTDYSCDYPQRLAYGIVQLILGFRDGVSSEHRYQTREVIKPSCCYVGICQHFSHWITSVESVQQGQRCCMFTQDCCRFPTNPKDTRVSVRLRCRCFLEPTSIYWLSGLAVSSSSFEMLSEQLEQLLLHLRLLPRRSYQ